MNNSIINMKNKNNFQKFNYLFVFLLYLGSLNTATLSSGKLFAQTVFNDPSFDPETGFNNTVESLVVQDNGKIVVGGQFTSFNGTGRTRIARLNANGSLDTSFDPGTGFDRAVRSLVVQGDGKIVVGGNFTSFNGTSRNRIARLNADGSLDTSFDPGTGFSFTVYSLALQGDGKILVVGGFGSFNGTSRNRVARLNVDGSLDTSFDPGTGFNGELRSLVLQGNGKIVVGGSFTSFNGTDRNSIVRLNTNGSLDTSFDSGTGFDSFLWSLTLQGDGKILVGGNFSNFNGTGRTRIARLNANGSLDTSFDPGTGFNSWTYSLALQGDGKILVVGQFTSFNGTDRNGIVRLNTDGSLDTNFDPETGFNNVVWSLALQGDGKILVGGIFSSFNGTGRNGIARLLVKANQSIGFDALAEKIVGDSPFDLTATASSGLAVTYASSNTDVATISDNTVTIVGAGTTNITASQAGNDDYAAASDVVQNLVVNKANQSITFDALPTKTIGDAAFNLTATASSGLAVSYSSSDANVATIAGSTVTIVGAGTTTITASQAGNANYNPAPDVTQSLTANAASGGGDPDPVVASLEDLESNAISLYPNPTENNLTVEGLEGEINFTVSDTQGQVVLSGQGEDTFEVDLSTLPAGIYTLSLENKGNTVSKKIVKQ